LAASSRMTAGHSFSHRMLVRAMRHASWGACRRNWRALPRVRPPAVALRVFHRRLSARRARAAAP